MASGGVASAILGAMASQSSASDLEGREAAPC
jgi:hypothetical protein